MTPPSTRAACALALCVLLTTPGCVMRYFEHHHLRPFTSETTTPQDVVYCVEWILAAAVTVGTLGLLAPLDENGTLWDGFNPFDIEPDDDSRGSHRKRVNPNNRPPPRVGRPIGRRRTR